MIPAPPLDLPGALRDLVSRCFSTDPEVASDARDAFAEETESLRLDEKQSRALIEYATDPALPEPEEAWEDTAEDMLQLLWQEPHESLLPLVVEVYGRVRPALRLALLTLVAAMGTRDAAEALVGLVREHGLPERAYQRLFRELDNLVDHADVLFPTLFERAGEQRIEVGNLLLGALESETLAPSAIKALAPTMIESLDAALDQAAPYQRDDGIAWRFDDKYVEHRSAAGFFADLAGFVEEPGTLATLRRALGFADPWIKLFATRSLLRLGEDVDDADIEQVARCHETRGILFSVLDALGQLRRFPLAFATLEAFAATDMVEWLKFPTELGREPEALEKMATFEADSDGDTVVLYVWRFRGEDGEWLAGASGPYEKEGVPGPVNGSATFSRFEPWESKSAEQHAESILDTLESWRKR